MSMLAPTSSRAELDTITEKVLDAGLEQLLVFGLRRSTVEDVARRAGVARVTVYRRFPTKQDLVTGVIRRETSRALTEIDAAVARIPDVTEKAIEGFVTAVRLARTHPLLRRLIDTEPDLVLPYLTSDAGPLIAVARTFLAERIRDAQAKGDAPLFDPEAAAEVLVRLTQSLLLTPHGLVDADDDQGLRRFAQRHLFAGLEP